MRGKHIRYVYEKQEYLTDVVLKMAAMTSPLRLVDRPLSSAFQEHSRRSASDAPASSSTSSLNRKDSRPHPRSNGIFPFSTLTENGISGRTQSFRDMTDVRTESSRGVICLKTVSQASGRELTPKASPPPTLPPYNDRCPSARTRARTPCGRSWTLTVGLLLLQLLAFSSMSVAQFYGETMTCEEGEIVSVPPEVGKDKPCISCVCENKIVVCYKKRCPSMEGCYWRLMTLSTECCQECKGCVHEGISYKHGSRWSDECQHYECQSGVLTTSQKHCHVPCYSPLPPAASGCCQRCEGCWLQGRRVPEGQVVSSKTDPCVQCACSDGKLTCEKRSCPVLSCPASKQVLSHDGCCMTCQATAALTKVEHNARFNFLVFSFNQLVSRGGPCLVCVPSHHNHYIHINDQQLVMIITKSKKSYFRKKYHCNNSMTPTLVIKPKHANTHLILQGACKYWLAKSCKGQDFSLKVINDARRSSHFSWTKSLSLKVPGAKVTLGQNLRIKINGQKVKPPFTEPGVLTLTLEGQAVSIVTPKGIRVLWDGGSYVEVEVPVSMRGHTCGLCGNFNGNATDDLTTKDGRPVATAGLMAMSWATGRARLCSRRMREQKNAQAKRNEAMSLGSTRPQRLTCPVARSKALSQCSILNSTTFQPCHAASPVDKFYESCILDMCECKPSRRCECDTLQAYARVCEHLGTPVRNWQSQSKCGGLECPRGAEYLKCAPPCRATCKNPTPNPNCYMRKCRPGCYCPPPSVLHRGACIPATECPKRGKKRHRNR
ncbi:kielin/chordin-like protein [Penaeus japonicus]|uniref:kielin/chordin-like protein n=1 Tax=Penaeus japonicus TaxID=27405 RepID=UPI001C716CC6|nr:kielin/chordin-like protein [Penaeus japonicus]